MLFRSEGLSTRKREQAVRHAPCEGQYSTKEWEAPSTTRPETASSPCHAQYVAREGAYAHAVGNSVTMDAAMARSRDVEACDAGEESEVGENGIATCSLVARGGGDCR